MKNSNKRLDEFTFMNKTLGELVRIEQQKSIKTEKDIELLNELNE